MESSFDCYTPLERPGATRPDRQQPPGPAQQPTAVPIEREDGECDTDNDSPVDEDSSSGDSDSKIPIRKIIASRRKRIPVPSAAPSSAPVEAQAQPQNSLLAKKKYNIWTERIREESLTETMRNFGVNRDGAENRNVEWYDHTMGGTRFAKDGTTNRLKRRRDSVRRSDDSRDSRDSTEKSGDSMDMDYKKGGKRVRYNKNNRQNKPRILEDLKAPEDATLEEVGMEIAKNLKETNEALIVQVTTVLGRELVQNLFKETQRIEEDGGMMLSFNRRRRTSGGVFLFLAKHDDNVGEEMKRAAFKPILEDPVAEEQKRDEEIEELKKTLITQDSPKCNKLRIDAIQNCSTLSNPPPSPVAAPEEEEGAIEDDVAVEEPSTAAEDLNNNSGTNIANDHMDFN